MSNGLELGVLKWLADNVWAGVLALLATIWGFLRADIHRAQKTADAALPRVEFDRIRDTSVAERQTLRSDVKELFSRDDKLKDQINERFNELRTEMHEGFTKLAEELRHMRPKR